VAESFLNFSLVARREAEQRGELAAVPEVMATAPAFDHDVASLQALLELGATIWS